MNSVGANIRKYREKLGLSQEELAHRLGYKSRSTINKIEMGINDVTQGKIVAFAKVLGCKPSDLTGWDYPDDVSEEVLKGIYLSFAKEAQENQIHPDDIRLAIETIRKIREKK